MRSKASILTSAIALAICVVCPLLDLFDSWDHALQTGTDTEYPLVVLALCVGAAFLLGRLALKIPFLPQLSMIRYKLQRAAACNSLFSSFQPATAVYACASDSPPLSLRI